MNAFCDFLLSICFSISIVLLLIAGNYLLVKRGIIRKSVLTWETRLSPVMQDKLKEVWRLLDTRGDKDDDAKN